MGCVAADAFEEIFKVDDNTEGSEEVIDVPERGPSRGPE
jgi:hypothetical protein